MLKTKATLALAVVCLAIPLAASNVVLRLSDNEPVRRSAVTTQAPSNPVEARLRADVAAMRTFRPRYPFWRHVFTIPDGLIAFGSAADGRLLATFPARGDWAERG